MVFDMANDRHLLQNNLASWELVFSVLDEGSFAKAAMKNRLDRPQLSRLIKALETEIGRPLFIRKGRQIRPTLFALESRETLAPLIENFTGAVKLLVNSRDELKGNIRFGAMPGFLQQQIVPLIVEFQKSYPEITFDVIAEENPEVLLNGSLDVVLYYGPRPEKGLVEHWVTRSLFVPCASPAYLKKAGKPKTPADLAEHSGIIFTGSCRPHSEVLQLGTDEAHYCWKSQIRFNNILSAKNAAVNGAGILLDCPAHHCFDDIVGGRLVPVLSGWHTPNLENYIGTTAEAASLKRVKTFIDWYIRRRREIEGALIRRLQWDFGVVVS